MVAGPKWAFWLGQIYQREGTTQLHSTRILPESTVHSLWERHVCISIVICSAAALNLYQGLCLAGGIESDASAARSFLEMMQSSISTGYCSLVPHSGVSIVLSGYHVLVKEMTIWISSREDNIILTEAHVSHYIMKPSYTENKNWRYVPWGKVLNFKSKTSDEQPVFLIPWLWISTHLS